MREALFTPIPSATDRAAELGVAGTLPAGFDAWFAQAVTRDASQRFANAEAALTALVPMLGAGTADTPSGAAAAPPVIARTVAWNGPIGDVPAASPSATPPRRTASATPWIVGAVVLAALAGIGVALRPSGEAPPAAPASPPAPAGSASQQALPAPLPPIAASPPTAPAAPSSAVPASPAVRHAAVHHPALADAGSMRAPAAQPVAATPPPAAAAPTDPPPAQAVADPGASPVVQHLPSALPGRLNPSAVRPVAPSARALPMSVPGVAPVVPADPLAP